MRESPHYQDPRPLSGADAPRRLICDRIAAEQVTGLNRRLFWRRNYAQRWASFGRRVAQALLPAALTLPSAQASAARPGRAERGGAPRSGDAARTSACATRRSYVTSDRPQPVAALKPALHGVVLLLAGAWCSVAAETPVARDFSLASTVGFCQDGARPQTPGTPDHLKIFGSYCAAAAGDSAAGTAKTTSFPAPANLTLYLAGYPDGKDLRLMVENTVTGEKFGIVPLHVPGDSWQRCTFALPSGWRGQSIDLIAGGHSTAGHGWLAFSEPSQEPAANWGTRDALLLLVTAIVHFALLALPAMAACAFAAAKNIRNSVTLAGIALAAVAAVGYVGFWTYFLWPELGANYAADLAIGAAIVFYIQFRKLDTDARKALRSLILPALLTGAAALLVLSTGFLYEGVANPLETPARRFSHQLPPDNQIPFLFAEGLHQGHIPRPLLGDWLSSDRPPLQTGIVLSQYAFMGSKAWGYTVLSVILQSLWVLGAWSVLQSFQVDRRAAAVALGVTLFSGFIFINTFFVWPKLLAAAFLLALTAYLHEIERGRGKAGIGAGCLAGSLGAFSLLAHGGSAFGLLGLGLAVILVGRRWLTWRLVGVSALALVSIQIPWILYQKLLDPPGDRLLKMHLAGIDKPDPRPVFEALMTAYADVGFSGAVRNKVANFEPLYGYSVDYWSLWAKLLRSPGRRGTLAEQLRAAMFFAFLPALGLVGLGIVALAIGLNPKKRSAEWRAAARMWLLIACVDAVWALLMFGPGTTITHQGTYLTMVLAFVGGVLALWAVAPWVAWTLGGAQTILSLWLYFVVMREPVPNVTLVEGAAEVSIAVLAVGALGAVVAILGCMAYARNWFRGFYDADGTT